MNNIDRTKFNIFLLGDTTVGKTSLVEVLSGMPFSEKKLTTIGVDFIFQSATFNGKKYTFKIFDTAGQERYQSIGDAQLKTSDGFLLIFSVDKKQTMERVSKWIESIEKNVNIDEKVLILVGNKIDIKEREVSEEEGLNYAKEKNLKYFETSAKTQAGVKEVFQQMYKDIYELSIKNSSNKKAEEANKKFEIKEKDVKENKPRKCYF